MLKKPKKSRQYSGLSNYMANEFEEANRKLKMLKAYKGKDIDRYMQNRALEVLGQLNKRTFNTRGLTPAQKVVLGQQVKKFNRSQTSSIQGAKETYSKKEKSFRERIEHLHGFDENNYDKYVDLLRHYSINELALLFGYPSQEEFWVELMDYVNMGFDENDMGEGIKYEQDKLVEQLVWETENLDDFSDDEVTKLIESKEKIVKDKLKYAESGVEIDDFIQEAFNSIR